MLCASFHGAKFSLLICLPELPFHGAGETNWRIAVAYGKYTTLMTGNFLTLLAALGALAALASLRLGIFNRPAMVRVRVESTVRRREGADDCSNG